MPYKFNNDRRHKFDKANYKVRNRPEYNESLKNRGSLTLWISDEAIKEWHPENEDKKRGGQRVYSDLAVETCLTIRSVYKLGLRQAEGFMESIAMIMNIPILIPDYSTLSRRSKVVQITKAKRKANTEPVHILIDSTGLKISGSGEWQETKHGLQKRRSWRKLHLAIDENTGDILASELTTNKQGDPSQVSPLLNQIDEKIDSAKADGAYDGQEVYDSLESHKHGPIKAIILPNKDARLSDKVLTLPTLRDDHIIMIESQERLNWQKKTGYNRPRLVETAMFRYKTIIGAGLRSKKFKNQQTEAQIGVKILNIMTSLGKPVSERV